MLLPFWLRRHPIIVAIATFFTTLPPELARSPSGSTRSIFASAPSIASASAALPWRRAAIRLSVIASASSSASISGGSLNPGRNR